MWVLVLKVFEKHIVGAEKQENIPYAIVHTTRKLWTYDWDGASNHVGFWPIKTLQAVAADLQPADSGPMTVSKQVTWTDDC